MREPKTDEVRRAYAFGPFVLSSSRRVLTRDGIEVPVIPRYLDLLLLLVAQRDRAVSRTEILDAVWNDVVVSDGALSQAIRTLRRTLGDDPREPRYIRTLARHGYRFVFDEVTERTDSAERVAVEPASPAAPASVSDRIDDALNVLLGGGDDAARRDAAETLHGLGTAEALRRLDRRPGHAAARALLRDARWDVPGAGPVPIAGQPGALTATLVLVRLRLLRAVALAGGRWLAAIVCSAAGGLAAGLAGGALLLAGPGSTARPEVLLGLAAVGLVAAAVGAFGVAGGLAVAETVFRSVRVPALVVLGALGGGLVGALAHAFGAAAVEGLIGIDLSPVTGGFEGLGLGGAAGLGYALATWRAPGMATPRGEARVRAASSAGVTTALAAAGLARSGHYLGAMSLDFMARALPHSQVSLDPLARLLGEPHAGPLTAVVIGAFEGLVFGSSLVFGLTRRPHRSEPAAETNG